MKIPQREILDRTEISFTFMITTWKNYVQYIPVALSL